MALSDITRKDARSDVLSQLGDIPDNQPIDEEINRYLNRGQFDFFNRMADLVSKWYGKKETISITAAAGAITEIALTANYGAEKVSKITKLITSDGTPFRKFEFEKLDYMLTDSNYDFTYGFAWYGEKLYVFVGTLATALSTDSSVMYFIRKPDEMGGDSNVFTVTFVSALEDDTIDVNGIRFTAKDAATTELADFITTGTDTADGDNFEDVLENVFQPITGVTAVSAIGVVTITGANTVTSSDGTRLAVAASTSSTVDVPTEYVDLVVMHALGKAFGKFQRQSDRQRVESDLGGRYADIHALFGESIQLKQLEDQPGVQTPGRNE